MPPVTRLGDNSTGHPCYPARPSVEASPNVYANGLAVVRKNDPYDSHCCGPACHDAVLDSGSSTVFVNGLDCGRQGDPMSCSNIDVADEHSPNVYAGG